MTTPTPRTDQLVLEEGSCDMQPFEQSLIGFARQLERELAEVQESRNDWREKAWQGAEMLNKEMQRTKRAEALAESYRKDAERYRWLRDCGLHHQIIGRITQSVGCGPYIAMRLPSTNSFNTVELDAGAADAAIDAAMKGGKT